ncbi:MAG: 23S rRNA pseudouridine(1911/1915/1917) synthase RluD [Pseudomonadota bacterium]
MISLDEKTTAPLLTSRVRPEHIGRRVDQVLSELFSEYSRSRLQRWIKEGRVTLDGASCRAKDKVLGGEEIKLQPVLSQEVSVQAEAIPLQILFEDEELLVINKPAGLVVHPAAGNPDGTLLNALLHHQIALEKIPRGGIVHRLDKDTSGLLVVAKTLQAQTSLVNQLQARSVKREYRAIVQGLLTTGGSVDAPIGRHPVHRVRMAVHPSGKPAVTHYRILERYRAHTYLRVNLETGRTHQIRVHMAHLHHPLLGDPVYGGRLRIPAGASPALQEALRSFRRQALHAARLELQHPDSSELMAWDAPLPEDMQRMLTLLQQDAALS